MEIKEDKGEGTEFSRWKLLIVQKSYYMLIYKLKDIKIWKNIYQINTLCYYICTLYYKKIYIYTHPQIYICIYV